MVVVAGTDFPEKGLDGIAVVEERPGEHGGISGGSEAHEHLRNKAGASDAGEDHGDDEGEHCQPCQNRVHVSPYILCPPFEQVKEFPPVDFHARMIPRACGAVNVPAPSAEQSLADGGGLTRRAGLQPPESCQ